MKRGGFLLRKTPLKGKRGLRRTSLSKTRKTASKRTKQTKADLWRSYGLERPAKPRYAGLKGIYWHVVSRFVRMRDFSRFGTCISCGREVTSWRDFQCGHFIRAEQCGFALLFDYGSRSSGGNLNGECPGCNAYDKQKLGYERNLDLRYGIGTASLLKDRYFRSKKGTPPKEWSSLEYDQKIRGLLEEVKTIEKCL